MCSRSFCRVQSRAVRAASKSSRHWGNCRRNAAATAGSHFRSPEERWNFNKSIWVFMAISGQLSCNVGRDACFWLHQGTLRVGTNLDMGIDEAPQPLQLKRLA